LLLGVAKVDRQKWSLYVNHVIEIKIYEVNNHVENIIEYYIVNVSAENSSKGSDDHILVILCSSA
jgi:Na+-transporting NADH:ubiquinone oxidoreductase subunit NqrC